MERAEFTAGSIEVRGSSPVHRLLSFLGAFFLGIEPGAPQERDAENWWDRDAPAANPSASGPMTLGHQAELFDDAGQVAAEPLARTAPPGSDARPMPGAKSAAKTIPLTLVSVQSKSRTTARVVATTRVISATRVSSVAKASTTARGAVARQLMLSQSISSGREESRWFSVPQRVLLPRYQLFEGAAAVTGEGGNMQIGSPSTRAQRGQVWFI
jgi:hypothetical protein